MCRALYALQVGELISKPVAAQWAEQTLAPEWGLVIRRALIWRNDRTIDKTALVETLRFIRIALQAL
jgi:hypothetical protein